MPISTVRPPFTRLRTIPFTGTLSFAACSSLSHTFQTLRLVVADEIAAFGLFALNNDFDRIARIEPGHASRVQYLRKRNETFGLQTDVDHDMLVGDLDHGAGHDNLFGGQICCSRSLGCLLAIEVG